MFMHVGHHWQHNTPSYTGMRAKHDTHPKTTGSHALGLLVESASCYTHIGCAGTLQGTMKKSRIISSYSPLVLGVNKQEFVAGWSAQALLPTHTRLGASTTHILALTSSNQVRIIPSACLNQRLAPLVWDPPISWKLFGHVVCEMTGVCIQRASK